MSGGSKKQKPTRQERALAEIGAKQWNRFREMAPALHQTVDRTRASTSDVQDLAAGASAQAAAQSVGMRPAGPGGAGVMAMHDVAAGQADAAGTAAASARSSAQAREMQGLMSAAALGRGIADDGIQGMAAGGQQAQAQAAQRVQQRQQMRQGLTSAAAMGVGAYGQHAGWFE